MQKYVWDIEGWVNIHQDGVVGPSCDIWEVAEVIDRGNVWCTDERLYPCNLGICLLIIVIMFCSHNQ